MFGGRGSVQLARVLGIRIGASPSWFVVLFLMIYTLSGYFGDMLDVSSTVAYLVAVAGAWLFFSSLALHELGHALVARRNGIGVLGIDLWLFGGVSKLTRDSQSPGEEFRVAAAGPAVTAVIAVACLGGVAATSRFGDTVDAFVDGHGSTPLLALLAWMGVINVWLLAFNLLPGYPLDGGRIARSIAWKVTGDRHRATRFSARLGQGLAYLTMGAGLFLALTADPVAGIWLLVLGWFLNQGARGAAIASTVSERLEGVTAADLMDDEPVAVPDGTSAADAQDAFFRRYQLPWFPVIDAAGHLLGLLREERVDGAVAAGHVSLTAADLLTQDGGDVDVQVPREASLEALLGSEALRRLGALAVVDADGRLCGLITLDQVRRALAAGVAGHVG